MHHRGLQDSVTSKLSKNLSARSKFFLLKFRSLASYFSSDSSSNSVLHYAQIFEVLSDGFAPEHLDLIKEFCSVSVAVAPSEVGLGSSPSNNSIALR